MFVNGVETVTDTPVKLVECIDDDKMVPFSFAFSSVLLEIGRVVVAVVVTVTVAVVVIVVVVVVGGGGVGGVGGGGGGGGGGDGAAGRVKEGKKETPEDGDDVCELIEVGVDST
jgi:hypothetical protein